MSLVFSVQASAQEINGVPITISSGKIEVNLKANALYSLLLKSPENFGNKVCNILINKKK